MLFMSPERLVPQENGEGDVLPTPQSDIYSFGLLIFQVRWQGRLFYACLCFYFRSLRANSHSQVLGHWGRYTLWFTMGGVQKDLRTPQPLGSQIRSGISPNAAGTAGWNYDQG